VTLQDFDLRPANDLGMTHKQRTLSLARESGLIETGTHLAYWALMKTYLRLYHRLTVRGRQHLPAQPPYILIANHTSHLDALVLASIIPSRLRDRVFPLAAGDFFFETPGIATFATVCVNALPLWRHNCGRHVMGELRQRLAEEPCVFVLFPEGTRSKDGAMGGFKAGLGMLVTQSTVPVIPCWISGSHRALSKDRKWPRPTKIILHCGHPLRFDTVDNSRSGWDQVAQQTRATVQALADAQGV
jgi:1-acyl-sn-glycerol-3-phosphate acyltransferase